MDIDERMIAFIDSFDKGNPTFLNRLERCAREAGVPVVRPQMQSLLKFLLAALRPLRILEVGTAVGFSALLMSEFGPGDCRITTLEKDAERAAQARENFAGAGRTERITLLEGDAAELLGTLEGPFDLIFMDAAKGQYLHFLPEVLRLLPEGGILVSDNVLQEGDVVQSPFAVNRRDRTIHARMREYLFELTHHPRLQTCILPSGDGAALSVKLGKPAGTGE